MQLWVGMKGLASTLMRVFFDGGYGACSLEPSKKQNLTSTKTVVMPNIIRDKEHTFGVIMLSVLLKSSKASPTVLGRNESLPCFQNYDMLFVGR